MMNAPKIQVLALLALLALLILNWGAPARAQDSDNAAAITAAQRHFDQGVAAYQNEDYAHALEEFNQAYAQIPAAIFLYNSARVAEKLEKYDESLKFAELAQAEVERPLPDSLVEKNTALIESLKQRIAQIDAAAKAKDDQATPTRFAHREPSGIQPEVPAAQSPTPTDEGWSVLRYSGGGVALLGLGLIGTSLYVNTDANQQIDELSTVDDPTDYNRRIDAIEEQQFTGKVLLFSGIATVAVGGALIAWDLLRPAEHAAATPAPAQPVSLTGVSISVEPDSAQFGILFRGVY